MAVRGGRKHCPAARQGGPGLESCRLTLASEEVPLQWGRGERARGVSVVGALCNSRRPQCSITYL